MPYTRIQRIETDPTRETTFFDAVRLADAFGIPVAWLLNEPGGGASSFPLIEPTSPASANLPAGRRD